MPKILVAPLEALTDDKLTDSERRVLLTLFSFRSKVTDTVWPGVEKIGERANIKDKARIGKITTALAKKGWLEKWKVGFSGRNQYKLVFPERLNTLQDTIGQPLEAESTYKAESTSQSRQNLPHHTRQNMPSADNKPVQQTIKQTSKRFKKPSLDELFEFKNSHQYLPDPHKFLNYYEGNGWKVGRSSMKCWKSTFRTWHLRDLESQKAKPKSNSIRGRSIEDALSDRSWANG